MNITEFNEQRSKLGVEGTGLSTVTTKNREWKHKTTNEVVFTIPEGSRVHVYFMPKTYPNKILVQYGDVVKISRTQLANEWLKGFTKKPSIRTLEKRSWDGISKSVTGKKVEADGYGPDGSPSWELVMGII
jgi:hypothetical protein